jgi:hypothetical protein
VAHFTDRAAIRARSGNASTGSVTGGGRLARRRVGGYRAIPNAYHHLEIGERR